MPKYRVILDYSASVSYDVEAADEDDAIEVAKQVEVPDELFLPKLMENLEFSDAWVDQELKEEVPNA